MKKLALALLLAACASPASDNSAPAPKDPLADTKTTQVRCLVDSPEGCSGCDQGDTCVYEQMTEWDCVYVTYGTKC